MKEAKRLMEQAPNTKRGCMHRLPVEFRKQVTKAYMENHPEQCIQYTRVLSDKENIKAEINEVIKKIGLLKAKVDAFDYVADELTIGQLDRRVSSIKEAIDEIDSQVCELTEKGDESDPQSEMGRLFFMEEVLYKDLTDKACERIFDYIDDE